MIADKLFNPVAVVIAIAGIVFTGASSIVAAATALNNGQANGFINAKSSSFSFKNKSRIGAPKQQAVGDEYTFNAQSGQTIKASVSVEDGSSLTPVLILISSQTGNQVAYDDKNNSLEYQVATSGEYRLLVLGQNNSKGRYTLSVSGLEQGAEVSQADGIMKDVLKLNEIGCGVPNVAKITIGTEERCTRDLDAGQYTYDQSSRSIKLASASGQTSTDERRQLLQNQYGLKVLDNCPTNKSSVTVVSFPESDQTYTYCATPNRVFPAGKYTYNTNTNSLDPSQKARQCTVNIAGNCVVK